MTISNINLPTAAEISRLPNDLKAKIAKRSRDKGSNYERDVAKKISAYFGMTWDKSFYRTKPHGHAQPNGDIVPINKMYELWKAYDKYLGVIECKNRKEWSFDNLFKNPEKSYLMGYWDKSNEDTESTNSVIFFTKPGVTDYVMHIDAGIVDGPRISFETSKNIFVIQTLKGFLKSHWPITN